MHDLLPLLFFVLGAIIASFIGVVVARLHTGESMVHGSSRCDACGRALTPRSLIPLFSYTLARGRAHCCGARLSPTSTVAECLLGILFVVSYAQLGLTMDLLLLLTTLSTLFFLVLYDLTHQILPPTALWLFVAFASFFGFISASSYADFRSTLLMAAVFAAFFALLHFASRGRAMGLADTPLVFALSLLVGPAALAGFLFSFWIGGAVGIVILFATPRGSRIGIEVPFAPFLAAGFLLAYFTQWNPLSFFALILGTG